MSGEASPAAARHGTWRLASAGDVDKRIREKLEQRWSVEQIAEAVGVATGYVEALIRDERGADAPPYKLPRPELAPAESPHALSRVHCIVAGAEIGARDCISRQCSDKCFCPRASYAINAIALTVLPGTRLEDELARCRAVARSVLFKSTLEERHLGPALVALRSGKPAPAPLIAGELPVPTPTPNEKVRRKLSEPEPERKGVSLAQPTPALAQVSRDARAAPPLDEVAAAVRAQRAPPTSPVVPAAEPAKEKPMGKLTDKACEWKEARCNERLGDQNKTGLCNRHNSVVYMRKKAAAKRGDKPAPAAPKPPVAKPAAPTAPLHPFDDDLADAAALIIERRDFHRDQVAKLERALEALRA